MFDNRVVKVIIPALNEQDALPHVLRAIPAWVDEVLVVDNGSTDATASTARSCGATVLAEPKRGYGQACLTGIAHLGRCDVVVFLDGDFSDEPSQMASLVGPIVADQADFVLGSRVLGARQRGSLTAQQRVGNALACVLLRLLYRHRYTDLGPFRAIRADALDALGMADRNYGWTVEMQIKALRAGLRIEEIPADYRPRIGVSKVSGTLRGTLGAGWKILSTIFRYATSPPPTAAGGRSHGVTAYGTADRVILFGRFPRPGRAKTRLVPALGPLGAAWLQRRMTERIARAIERFADGRRTGAGRSTEGRGGAPRATLSLEFRFADGPARQVRRWLGGRYVCRRQPAGDLGQRMAACFDQAFGEGAGRVVLVGTDCPALSPTILRRAMDALRTHDVVLGPTHDGGYYLIGLRRRADLFGGIHWSTAAVLAETITRAERQGLSVGRVERLYDIDEPADLDHLPTELRPDRPFVSVIIPALNEVEVIEHAVASARGEDAEVIVVDGGSTDGTRARAAQAGAAVLAAGPGRGGQMNSGASQSTGEVLLFLHADTVLPPGYASMVFEALADRHAVGGAFTFRTDYDRPAMRIVDRLVRFRSRNLHMPYGDQAMFVRRDIFQRAGTFPDVPLAEDFLLVRRLNKRGRLVILDAPAVTSGRRWRSRGCLRTTAINQLIVLGLLAGISPRSLAGLYEDIHQ